MAKPTSLPDAALTHAAEQALARLAELPPLTPPEAPTPPEHELPPTSVALPEQALPLPEQAGVPDWLLPA
jgi:hypothetical protein